MLNGCKKCMIDPTGDDFPDRFISLHKDMATDLSLSEVTDLSVFTYIVLTYDMNSPYVLKFKDWAQRRRETAKAANFETKHDRYVKEAEKIILGKNKQVNILIVRYLFLQNDIDFIKYQGKQALYFRQVKASIEKDFQNPAHYDKLSQNMDALAKELKILQFQIFSGNESEGLAKTLYDFAGSIKVDFRPEQIADKLNDGKEIVDTVPYNEGYEVEDLKFVDDN